MKSLISLCLMSFLTACAHQSNTRDVAIPDQSIQIMLEERLKTSGQPTLEDLDKLQAQGVTTIISLRPETENTGYDESVEVTKRGMHFITLPINGKSDITPEKAEELNTLLEQTKGTVLLHCASGNRVGALVAIIANKQGETPEQSILLGKKAGLGSLQSTVEPLLKPKCEQC